jgi:hypothetical protein
MVIFDFAVKCYQDKIFARRCPNPLSFVLARLDKPLHQREKDVGTRLIYLGR